MDDDKTNIHNLITDTLKEWGFMIAVLTIAYIAFGGPIP